MHLFYYAFDVMILGGRDVMAKPLVTRRAILQSQVLVHVDERLRELAELHDSLPDLIQLAALPKPYSASPARLQAGKAIPSVVGSAVVA
jgi:hypothetical protein